MLAVCSLGILALTPASPAAGAPQAPVMTLAETASPEPALRPAPVLYPWRAPQPFQPPQTEMPEPSAPLRREQGFINHLSDPHGDPGIHVSMHDNNDGHFGGHWRPENVVATGSGTTLVARQARDETRPFTAAEIQIQSRQSYGRYETIMRPARGNGVVSAFFTFTGPWFGDPHDEIDIEFLGRDTTQVYLNYFTRGRRYAPATIDLPFDAADAERLYAIEWTPERITWFIDNRPIYSSPVDDTRIPAAPSKLYLSIWPGSPSIHGWTGQPSPNLNTGAHFSCVSFVPLGGTGPSCADGYEPPKPPSGLRADLSQ